MDPTSALGAAAASAQFLGYGVKGLIYAARLLRDIKGAPDDSLRIVARLEKEIASMTRLLSSDSSTFSQFTTAQYVHIAPWALEARKALDEANKILAPLSSQLDGLRKEEGAGKRLLQAWKSILTVKAMREVKKQLDTIQTLNVSLVRELHVAGFETQYLLCEQSAEVLAKVTEIATVNNELQQSIGNLSSQYDKTSEMLMASSDFVASGVEMLNQANQDHQVIMTQAISSIGNEISAVRRGMQTADENSRTLNLSMKSIETTVIDQTLLLETQLENFIRIQGDENQRVLVGEMKKMLVTELVATVNHFARDNLVSTKPKDSISQPSVVAKSTESSHTTRSSSSLRCLCKRGRISTSKKYGLFRFKIDHQSSQLCPLHGKIAQHSYSIETRLSPWLNGALELTLGALCSNSSWSILPSLRFHGTVKRSESPIYQLFDNLYKILPYDGVSGSILYRSRPDYRNRPDARELLSDLIFGIKQAVTSGSASCSDVDENGKSLLTETANLMVLMKISEISGEIHTLLEMSRKAELDPAASMRGYFENGFDIKIFEFIFLFRSHIYILNTSFYNTIIQYEEMAESFQTHYRKVRDEDDKILMQKWIIGDPDFAAAAGHGDPLQQAVLRRSFDGLKGYFRNDKKYDGRSEDHVSLLVMAVGWPEGLQYLIEHQNHLDLEALSYAASEKAAESLEIILSANSTKLFTLEHLLSGVYPGHFYPALLRTCMSDLSSFRRAVEELRNRHDDFRHALLDSFRIALESPASRHNIWVRDLTYNNYEFHDLLTQKFWNPECLDELDPFISASLYYGSLDADPGTHMYFQVLFDAGFVHTDTACGRLGTPLAWLCQQSQQVSTRDDAEKWHKGVWWFLSKGANRSFWFWRGKETGMDWSHLQFYVAATMEHGYYSPRKLLRYCGQEYVQDGCFCPCSSEGCIPPFKFWRDCEADEHEHCRDRLSRRWTDLAHWTKWLNYSTSQKEHTYREVCRLELFDRLGLKHRCCMGSSYNHQERERFRQEDAKSENQLELLMIFYKRVRRFLLNQPVEQFWSIWWATVDVVVLPLIPMDACTWPSWAFQKQLPHPHPNQVTNLQNRLAIDREDAWADLLESNGYKDWDYEDVIKHHFAQLWLRAKEHKQRKQLWKRHRLMLKPRFIGQKRRGILKDKKDNEGQWVSDSDDEWV